VARPPVAAATGRTSAVRNDQGFTLAETLAAVGVLGIGLVALLSSMSWGFATVDSSRRSTTALFLAAGDVGGVSR
jgi:prepilin-type N-terminal cleavage/methylation domain-containing protein